MLAVQYFRFFLSHKKLTKLFGSQILIYSALLLVVSAYLMLLQRNIAFLAPLHQALVGISFALVHATALSSLIRMQLSSAQKDYLTYLGFTRQQLRLLARAIAAPAYLAGFILLLGVLTPGLPGPIRLATTIATIPIMDLTCFTLLRLQENHEKRLKAASKQRTPNRAALLRAFKSPYRAFVKKDLRELRTPEMLSGALVFLIPSAGIMLFAGAVPFWHVFTICFYIILALAVEILCFSLYQCEEKAYLYYRCQLYLTDRQIITYKLLIQWLALVCVSCLFLLAYSLIFTSTLEFLLITTVITLAIIVYLALLCIALGFWFIQRLQKGREFHSLYALGTVAVTIIPGFAVLYLLAICLPRFLTTHNPHKPHKPHNPHKPNKPAPQGRKETTRA